MRIRGRTGAVLACLALLGVPGPAPAVSNTGTEFWAADLDNFGTADTFGIAVSNRGIATAQVRIEKATGEVASASIAPGGSHTFAFPRDILQETGVGSNGTYRVISDQPLVAYQFNPLGQVATNDASLLLPTTTLGTEYYVMSYPTLPSLPQHGGLVTIVATNDDTEVTVTVSGRTRAGGPIPALASGDQIIQTLDRFESLHLTSLGVPSDLTGTHVLSDKPVAVFGGHECTFIPWQSYACDHLEEQMFPVNTWGSSYAQCRSKQRGSEPAFIRVMARNDDTTVTTTPELPGTPVTLAAGSFVELEAQGDVLVQGDDQILLAEYMASQNFGAGIGDPSMTLGVPTAQFRSTYQFLTPTTFSQDWLTVTAPVGATVRLDDQPIGSDAFTPLGDSGFACARVLVGDGVHRVDAGDNRVGLVVYGYHSYASYAYPAGLELDTVDCERGLRVLHGTPADGAVSRTVHEQVEPTAERLGEEAGDAIHQVSCDVISPAEDTVDGIMSP